MRAVFMAPRLCLMNGEIEIASELAISYDTIRDRVGKRAINWIRRRSRKVKRMEIWLDENWLGFTYFGSVKSEMRRATRRSFIVIHTKELRLMRYIKSENELWASLFGVLNQLTRSFTLSAEWDKKCFFLFSWKSKKEKIVRKLARACNWTICWEKWKRKEVYFVCWWWMRLSREPDAFESRCWGAHGESFEFHIQKQFLYRSTACKPSTCHCVDWAIQLQRREKERDRKAERKIS